MLKGNLKNDDMKTYFTAKERKLLIDFKDWINKVQSLSKDNSCIDQFLSQESQQPKEQPKECIVIPYSSWREAWKQFEKYCKENQYTTVPAVYQIWLEKTFKPQ